MLKKFVFWNVNFFFFKLPNSSGKPVKKLLHLKMLTLQNVKFKMSEYSNMTVIPKGAILASAASAVALPIF